MKGERYIALLYNSLIKDNKKILFSDSPIEKVHALGTPDELNQILSDLKSKRDPL